VAYWWRIGGVLDYQETAKSTPRQTQFCAKKSGYSHIGILIAVSELHHF